MASITHYDVLGISQEASQKEIRTAYLALAHASHPDKHPKDPNAGRRFLEISAAYDVLSDPSLRRAYDLALKPPKTIEELLLQHADGKRALEHLFETAPAAPHHGEDIGMIVSIPLELLKHGGVFELVFFQKDEEKQALTIQIPPKADQTPWCRLPNLGNPGKNGGSIGDLFLFFQPQG